MLRGGLGEHLSKLEKAPSDKGTPEDFLSMTFYGLSNIHTLLSIHRNLRVNAAQRHGGDINDTLLSILISVTIGLVPNLILQDLKEPKIVVLELIFS